MHSIWMKRFEIVTALGLLFVSILISSECLAEDSAQVFSASTTYVGGSKKNILADLNNDGLNDVIADKVFINDGVGGFTEYDQLPIAGDYSGSDVKDIDNDGDLDYVICKSPQCQIYLNDGTGQFSLHTTLNTSPGSVYDCRVVDLNNDGFVDIVVNGHGYSYPADIFWNNHDGSFEQEPIAPYGTSIGIDVGDYDNDGDFDLLWTNNMSTHRIYKNDGVGNFSPDYGFFWSYANGSPLSTFTDLDSDGFLDAIILSYVTKDSTIYLNNSDRTFNFTGDRFGGYLYKSADIDNDGDDDISLII